MVERIEIAGAQWERSFRRVTRLRGNPAMPVQVLVNDSGVEFSGEPFAYPRGHPGFRVDIDPEAFGFHQASVVGVDTYPHGAPFAGYPGTPASQMHPIRPPDRPDYIDHCAPDNPRRMYIQRVRRYEIVETHILKVAGYCIETEASIAVDIAGADRPGGFEDVSGMR